MYLKFVFLFIKILLKKQRKATKKVCERHQNSSEEKKNKRYQYT